MAAAVSWVESFKMPLREIRRKYTKSDLVIMAWRSVEISANMEQMRDKDTTPSKTGKVNTDPKSKDFNPNGIIETEDSYILPEEMNGGVAIPKKFFDETGELNLSKVSGPQAVAYLNALGLNIGGRV